MAPPRPSHEAYYKGEPLPPVPRHQQLRSGPVRVTGVSPSTRETKPLPPRPLEQPRQPSIDPTPWDSPNTEIPGPAGTTSPPSRAYPLGAGPPPSRPYYNQLHNVSPAFSGQRQFHPIPSTRPTPSGSGHGTRQPSASASPRGSQETMTRTPPLGPRPMTPIGSQATLITASPPLNGQATPRGHPSRHHPAYAHQQSSLQLSHSPPREKDKKKGFPFFKRRKNRDKEQEAYAKAQLQQQHQAANRHHHHHTHTLRDKVSGGEGSGNWGLGQFMSNITRPHHEKAPSSHWDLRLDTNMHDMEGIVNLDKAASLKDYPAGLAGSQRGGRQQRSTSDDIPGPRGKEWGSPLGMSNRDATRSNRSLHHHRHRESKHSLFHSSPRADRHRELNPTFGSNGSLPLSISPTQARSMSPEAWLPPDSWAVLPATQNGQPHEPMYEESSAEESPDEDDGTPYFLRIYRRDSTFCTVSCRINSTSAEVIRMAAKKFYIEDSSKYCLYIKKANAVERTLSSWERPAHLLRQYLEQMGYTKEDNLSSYMREDNSYLCQFLLIEAAIPSVSANIDHFINSMKHIDLRRCRLQTIPVALYQEPSKILYLNLSKNLRLNLPSDFAQLCTSLRELRLSSCLYRRVPVGIRYLTNLMLLDLSGNLLRDLDNAHLEDLPNLQDLLVRNNRLERLSDSFAYCQTLRRLTLSNNNFSEFPEVICRIRTLTEVDLSFNFISMVPNSVGDLTRLRNVSFLCNRLTGALPTSLQNMQLLERLDIRRNNIQDINVLSKLPRLKELYCDHNALSTLHGNFQALTDLSLAKSYLTSFALRDASHSLTHLNLSHCQLSELPAELFTYLPALVTLRLDTNHLTTLPKSIGQLLRLQCLSCTNNLLSYLPTSIAFLPELTMLDVHSNNIKALFSEIWLAVKLEELNISSNLLGSFPHPSQAERSLSAATAVSHPLVPSRKGSVDPTGYESTSSVAVVTPGGGDGRSHSDMSYSGRASPTMRSESIPHNGGMMRRGLPLATGLKTLRMGGNFFNDDVFTPVSFLEQLRVLNMSFNEQIYEVPPGSFQALSHLEELYLSGTQLATLPGEDLDRLRALRILHVNANKLQTLPAELGKIGKLAVLDAGSNMLRYNISNWPYDWNWNWNLELRYLNLSNNKKLEIKRSHIDVTPNNGHRDLADFGALTNLRVLGLMDVTMVASPPDQTPFRRIRTSASEVNWIHYGMADKLGPDDNLTLWDFVVPRFRGSDDECLFGLFDSRSSGSAGGSRLFAYMNDAVSNVLKAELDKLKPTETPETALRRTFLTLNKQLGGISVDGDHRLGAAALVAYFDNSTVYVANVGNVLAVASRKGSAQLLATKHTPADFSEVKRIRTAGGFISQQGLVQGELEVTRSFGYFHLLPYVNANPSIEVLEISEDDEFVIIASRGLWEHLSYQTAVDVARTLRHDANLAAQKLRDYAISYGADKSLMVMVLGLRELLGRKSALRSRSTTRSKVLPTNWGKFSLGDYKDELPMSRVRRGVKEELPADSTLARLEREVEPPTGSVALVFTDIKNSTFMWETIPIAMRSAIRVHNGIMRRLLRTIGGYEVKTEGDAFMVSFPSVASAIHWCVAVQLHLLKADWPQEILDSADGGEIYSPVDPNQLIYRGLWVRMGIHWGNPLCEEDPITRRMDYFGPMVNRAARICGAADGGQIFLSQDVVNELISIKEMIDSDANFLTAHSTSAGDHTGHSSSSASATSIAAAVATAAHNGSTMRPELLYKDIQALKKLGLNIIHIGDRRLKGLETPETLAWAYPRDLGGRVDYVQMKAAASAELPVAPFAEPVAAGEPTAASESPAPPPLHPNVLPSGEESPTMPPPTGTTTPYQQSTAPKNNEPPTLPEITELLSASPSNGPRIIVRPPTAD
ncbi:cysteinyl-tRNA synthetase, partial [Dimargaris verticillata]